MSSVLSSELQYLPVSKLQVHFNNPRFDVGDVGDVSDLTASVRELGVCVPLLVEPVDGEDAWYVIAGTRRLMAAREAKIALVPCIEAQTDSIVLLGLAENERRKPLTVAERARAYAQLQIGGMNPDDIAKRTASPIKEVRALLNVSKAEKQLDAVHEHDLTLEQAAAIAEFADDEQRASALIDVATKEPDQFMHTVARLRQDRRDVIALDKARREWSKKGYTVIVDAAPPSAKALTQLSDVDDDSHGDCPGRAVLIDIGWYTNGSTRVTHYCLDWEGNEHKTFAKPGRVSRNGDGSMTDEARVEAKEVREHNKEWRAAATVRLDWLVELLKRRSAPVEVLPFVAEMLLTRVGYLGRARDEMFEKLAGRSVEELLAAELKSTSRVALTMLAQVASAFESTMDEHTWQTRHDTEARWLRFLHSIGYALSPIEQRVIDDAKLD